MSISQSFLNTLGVQPQEQVTKPATFNMDAFLNQQAKSVQTAPANFNMQAFTNQQANNRQATPAMPQVSAPAPVPVDAFSKARTDLAKAQTMLTNLSEPSRSGSREGQSIAQRPDDNQPVIDVKAPEPVSFRDQASSFLSGQLDGSGRQNIANEREAKAKEVDLAFKGQESRRVKNELTGMRIQFEEDMEEIEKNKSGTFGPSAFNSRKNKLTTDYNRNSVRKTLEYHMLNEDFTAAQNSVDTYISDLKSEDTNRLNIFKTLMDFEQNDMTESEKLQAQQAFSEKQSERDFQNQKDLASFRASLEVGTGFQGTQNIQTAAGNLVANPTVGTVDNFLASVFQNSKISGTVKTNLGNVLAVSRAVADFAEANPDGKFKGITPIEGKTLGLLSLGRGIFSSQASKKQRASNITSIEAINLKVQQWASGAALTDQQTEQVDRLTLTGKETDVAARNKTNSLYNFMLDQAETQLLLEGINQRMPRVELFELGDLASGLSPEQEAEARAAGLIN